MEVFCDVRRIAEDSCYRCGCFDIGHDAGAVVRAEGDAAESQKGAQILLLGTQGGPRLNKQRSEPASLLIVDGRAYLIDCGIGTMRRMLDAGASSQTIGTIFITHNHPDHVLGLVDVLANDFFNVDLGVPGTVQGFNIYGPPETPALVKAAYDYIRIPYGIFAAEPLGASTLVNPFKAHVIDHDGLAYQDDKIHVTATENTHYQLLRPEYHATMKSHSYRFETPYGSIVFTGDTGPSTAVAALAKGADVLISEVTDVEDTANANTSPGFSRFWRGSKRNGRGHPSRPRPLSSFEETAFYRAGRALLSVATAAAAFIGGFSVGILA